MFESHLMCCTRGRASEPHCLGYSVWGGCRRLRAMQVMRPARSLCSSPTMRAAVSSVSTTTWNRELPAVTCNYLLTYLLTYLLAYLLRVLSNLLVSSLLP